MTPDYDAKERATLDKIKAYIRATDPPNIVDALTFAVIVVSMFASGLFGWSLRAWWVQ